MRQGYERARTLVGTVILAGLAVFAGAIGLLNLGPPSSDALAIVLPDVFDTLFEVAYLASGVLMILGVCTGRGRLEGPGWILLAMSVVVRGIALVSLVGLDPAITSTLVLYGLVVWGAYERVMLLRQGYVIVRAKGASVDGR